MVPAQTHAEKRSGRHQGAGTGKMLAEEARRSFSPKRSPQASLQRCSRKARGGGNEKAQMVAQSAPFRLATGRQRRSVWQAVLAAEEGRQSARRIRNEQERKIDRLSCPAAKRISGKLTGRMSDRKSRKMLGRRAAAGGGPAGARIQRGMQSYNHYENYS